MKDDSKSKQTEEMTLTEDNILIDLSVKTYQEVIRTIGQRLYDNGFVKDSFLQAVLDREEVYPTGLQVTGGGIAIPHADSEHVITSTLGIATLTSPVDFRAMAEPQKIIPVSVVMMLAVSDPHNVVSVLRKVIFILENADALKALQSARSPQSVLEVLEAHIASQSDRVKE